MAVKTVNERAGEDVFIVSGDTLAREAFHLTEHGKTLAFEVTDPLFNEVIDSVSGPLEG